MSFARRLANPRPAVARAALLALCLIAAGCRGTPDGADRTPVSPCAGAGFVGGEVKTDGLFAARIPYGCATGVWRSCTVRDGHGPIDREIVPAGAWQACFAFNQFVGAGLPTIPGYESGECFGQAVLRARGVPVTDRPTFRCDGGRAARSNAGTRMPEPRPVRGTSRISGRWPDPWGVGPNAGGVGDQDHPTRAPDWAVLVWRRADGLTCFEPGQRVDRHTPGRSDQLPGVPAVGRLRRAAMVGSLRYDSRSGVGVQLYGLGRFTRYDPTVGGSCGRPDRGIGLLASWETRYARRDQGFAVTALSGVAGRSVARVEVRVRRRWLAISLAAGGAFVVAVRGIRTPADLPLRVGYRDGRRALLAAEVA